MKHSLQKQIKTVATIAIAALIVSSSVTSILFAAEDGGEVGKGLGGNAHGFIVTGAQTTKTVAAADTTEPGDVDNLKAVPGDSEVQLTWDAATDNVGVTGYKIYRGTHAVKSSEDQYDLPVVPVGNVKTYTVKNLTNNKAYFFTITALDAAGNESPDYANEASATPKTGLHLAAVEDDGKAPQVKKVTAIDVITVQVVFSEPVRMPEEQPQSAFKIEKISDKSKLVVQKAEIDGQDATGATVLLTTAPQEDGANYVLTAGIEVKDFFDNPIISGTADTGSFKGSKKQAGPGTPPPPPPTTPGGPATGPTVATAAADMNNRISVNFSKKITLSNTPKMQFSVINKNTQAPLTLTNISLSVDETTAYLSTVAQVGVDYVVTIKDVKDGTGATLSPNPSTVTVKGNTGGITDLVPPEDVTKLIARIKDAKTNLVELQWQGSKNSAGDMAGQMMYQGSGKTATTFGKGVPLDGAATTAQIQSLKGGQWYTFKVTAQDTTGNESKGSFASLYLPQTGPGMVAAGITALVMGLYARKKKK